MLRVFEDRDDRPDTVIRINALTNRDAGIIVGHAAPPGLTASLPQDLLLALGHDPSAAGWPRTAQLAWRLARAWMAGFEIGHLVIYGGWRLNTGDASTLSRIADDGINVNVVTLRTIRRLPPTFRALPVAPVEDLLDNLTGGTRSDDEPHRRGGFSLPTGLPPLPAADATCFASECAGRIEDGHIWGQLCSAFDAITARVRQRLERARSPDDVLAVLEQQIRWARDSNDLIVAVRACQLAALRSRWLIRLSLREVGIAAAMALNTASERHQRWPWPSHTDPKLQAAAALAWGAACTVREIADATIGDLGADCQTFVGRPLEAAMTPPIRAQRWLRRDQGRSENDPLIPTPNGHHHRPAAIRRALDESDPSAFNAAELGPTVLRKALEDIVEVVRIDDGAELHGPDGARRALLPSARYQDWTCSHGGAELQRRTGLPQDAGDTQVRDGRGFKRAMESATGTKEPPPWAPNHAWEADSEPADVSADSPRLHAILLSVGGGADRDSLMRGLQWSAERLQRAEQELRTGLSFTAEILAAPLDGRLELRFRSDHATATAVELIRKREDSDLGLSPLAARLLMQVLEGRRCTVHLTDARAGGPAATAALDELLDRRLVYVEATSFLGLCQGVRPNLHAPGESIPATRACT